MKDREKKKEFLICVDSDGSAMDTMEPKHRLCFAPLFAREFGFNKYYDTVVDYWLWYNLYSKTRGVNRFRSCAHLLRKFSPSLYGLDEFVFFVDHSDELSNRALEIAIENSDNSTIMKRALSWSISVNTAINKLNGLKPFDGVKEAFERTSESCDIAAVSSANKNALQSEWNKFGLSQYCIALMSQEEGTKSQCIKKLLDKGYDRKSVIMVGDAPGDLEAAKECGVYFYPIVIRKEAESWKSFVQKAVIPLTEGKLTPEIQEKWINEFENALGGNDNE
ncbi:MAG: HAD family hydrolase [Acutalibacteraceae bacterium]